MEPWSHWDGSVSCYICPTDLIYFAYNLWLQPIGSTAAGINEGCNPYKNTIVEFHTRFHYKFVDTGRFSWHPPIPNPCNWTQFLHFSTQFFHGDTGMIFYNMKVPTCCVFICARYTLFSYRQLHNQTRSPR